MSFFSNALDSFLREREWTQSEFSERTGGRITQGQISQYRSGALPKVEALEIILGVAGEAWLALLSAYLKDQTPEAWRPKILLQAAGEHSQRIAETGEGTSGRELDFDRLPPPTKALLARVAAAVMKNPKVEKVVESALSLVN